MPVEKEKKPSRQRKLPAGLKKGQKHDGDVATASVPPSRVDIAIAEATKQVATKRTKVTKVTKATEATKTTKATKATKTREKKTSSSASDA